jgi:hypothetical protein
MNVHENDLQALLQKHLQDKLERDTRYVEPQAARPGASLPGGAFEAAQPAAAPDQSDREKETNRLQHRIYQLRDRLAHDIFGRDSESLADAFITRFDLPVEKRSPEYYQILRRVLRLEIEYHALLMERISGNHSGE